jgi:hypothetical protein
VFSRQDGLSIVLGNGKKKLPWKKNELTPELSSLKAIRHLN